MPLRGSDEALRGLLKRITNLRNGTKVRQGDDAEIVEVETIHKTLNVVLHEIELLLAGASHD